MDYPSGGSSEEPWLDNPARDPHGGSLSWKNPVRNLHGPQLWRPCRVGGKVPLRKGGNLLRQARPPGLRAFPGLNGTLGTCPQGI